MEYLRDFNLVTVTVRLLLAFIFGGVIGMDRERKGRPAGMRTHILVCLGASMTTMSGFFVVHTLGMESDPLRISAQVISGIGFLGVGTILITGRMHVKGLTTAAGLWTTASIGIALGAGFYEGALMMCVLIYVVLVSLNKLDSTHVKASRVMNVYVELKSGVPLSALLRAVKSMGIQVNDIQDIGSRSAETHGYILELEIMRPELGHVEAAEQVAKIEQVEFCEEMKA